MLVMSTSNEIGAGYGVLAGATTGGGRGTGCGPGEFCAHTVVGTAMHTAAKAAKAPLRRENKCGMQILRNCAAELSTSDSRRQNATVCETVKSIGAAPSAPVPQVPDVGSTLALSSGTSPWHLLTSTGLSIPFGGPAFVRSKQRGARGENRLWLRKSQALSLQ